MFFNTHKKLITATLYTILASTVGVPLWFLAVKAFQ